MIGMEYFELATETLKKACIASTCRCCVNAFMYSSRPTCYEQKSIQSKRVLHSRCPLNRGTLTWRIIGADRRVRTDRTWNMYISIGRSVLTIHGICILLYIVYNIIL